MYTSVGCLTFALVPLSQVTETNSQMVYLQLTGKAVIIVVVLAGIRNNNMQKK